MIILYDQCFRCRADSTALWSKFTEIAKNKGVDIEFLEKATDADYKIAKKAEKNGVIMPFWLDDETGKFNQSLTVLIAEIQKSKKSKKSTKVADGKSDSI